jgi:hypothetical protein
VKKKKITKEGMALANEAKSASKRSIDR